MTNIERTVRIDAPRDEVWGVLADIGAIDDWCALVAESKADGTGVGATRSCTFAEGGAIEERVTTWEDGRRLAYEITGDLPAETVISEMHLDDADDAARATEVTYATRFDPADDADQARAEMEGTAEFVLQSLKHFVERGEVLEPPADG